MRSNPNGMGVWESKWVTIEKKYLPAYVWGADLLTYWRERILLSICFITIVSCPFALIPALYICSANEMWDMFLLDVIAYFTVVFIFHYHKLSLVFRSSLMCFLLCSLGVGLLFKLGPISGGYVWLFGASVLGGAIIGLRAGVSILGVNCLSYFGLNAYIFYGNPLWISPDDYSGPQWIVRTLIFLILNAAITLTTALMLRGMEDALNKEKAYADVLRESEERYRLLADNATDVIWTMNRNKDFTYVSPSVVAFRGFTSIETMNQSLTQILRPESLDVVETLIEKEWDNIEKGTFRKTVVELMFNSRNGSAIWGESTISAIYNENGSFRELIGVTRNVADRRQVQDELKYSEERLRTIVEAARNVAFVITDAAIPDMVILEASPGAETIFGYTRDVIRGLYYEALHMPEDMRRINGVCQKMMDKEPGLSEEMTLVRKSGEPFPTLFSMYPLCDENDTITSFLFVVIDISEQKKLEKRLIQSEKMAALGGLVAGLVHEISTPLGVVLTSASFLSDKTETFAKDLPACRSCREVNAKYLNTAIESCNMMLGNIRRTVSLVNSFKQVAVDQAGEAERLFVLKNYLEDIVLTLQPQLKGAVNDIDILCSETLMLESYPGSFYQVISNLIVNSVLHGFEGDLKGKILIEVSQDEHHITIQYSDNGVGILPENIGKIFDPFFTTRRNRGGSGLGLHIVYNIITQRLGGQISCESEPGSGVHFTLLLPNSNVGVTSQANDQALFSTAG